AIQILTPIFAREHLGASSTTAGITAESVQGLMISGITPDGRPIGPVQDLTVAVDEPGAWMIANQTIDRHGRAQSQLPSWVARCVPADAAGMGAPFGPKESA